MATIPLTITEAKPKTTEEIRGRELLQTISIPTMNTAELFGTENLQRGILAVDKLASVVRAILADGKVSFIDLMQLPAAWSAVKDIVEAAPDCGNEIKDLSEEEAKQLGALLVEILFGQFASRANAEQWR